MYVKRKIISTTNNNIHFLEYKAVPTGMAELVFGPEDAIKFPRTVSQY